MVVSPDKLVGLVQSEAQFTLGEEPLPVPR